MGRTSKKEGYRDAILRTLQSRKQASKQDFTKAIDSTLRHNITNITKHLHGQEMGSKRPPEANAGPAAKRGPGTTQDGGADGANDETDSKIIMKFQKTLDYIDVPFRWNSLSEFIPAGGMFWFPFMQFPGAMFTESTKNEFDKFYNVQSYTHYEWLDNPKLTLSKFVFMQESIIGQGSTPSATTAPTQSSYLWSWSPTNIQAPWFQIMQAGCTTPATFEAGVNYGLRPQTTKMIQQLTGVTDLNTACIRYGGLDTSAFPKFNFTIDTNNNVYTTNGKPYIPVKYLSGNVDTAEGGTIGFYSQNNLLNTLPIYNYIKEQGNLTPIQLGDELNISIKTGLKGVKITTGAAPYTNNAVKNTERLQTIPENDIEFDTYAISTFSGVPMWPSENMLNTSRKYGTYPRLNQYDNLKKHSRHHTFFSIAPITDASGNQIKQSVSFVAELNWTMRFYVNYQLHNSTAVSFGVTNNMRYTQGNYPVYLLSSTMKAIVGGPSSPETKVVSPTTETKVGLLDCFMK
nr:MAG: major capsid protein [Army ant associated bidensovirus 7]